METDPRLECSCGEAGDLMAAGQMLIVGGARLKDGLMVRAGIHKFKEAGWPFQVIVMMAKRLIQDDRRTPNS